MTQHRKDLSEPEIRKGLEDAGCVVWDALPSDLLVWHPRWAGMVPGFALLEAKTLQGKRDPKIRIDPRQKAQEAFLALTGTPKVATPEAALWALGFMK